MRHKWNKTKLTFHLCEKCGAKKKLVKMAKFQKVWNPDKRIYEHQMLRPAEYQFRSVTGKLLKSMPNCIGISYSKYGSQANQMNLFEEGEVI